MNARAEGSSLRPVKPLQLGNLKPADIGGKRPSLMWVTPTSLMVDATYQRDLSERSARLIRKMCENFKWNRLKPPIVVKVEGGVLHVIDGQHTAIMAATINIKEIPVYIVEADTIDERARAFVGHNSDRVSVSPFDIYRALVASGDADATDVANVCNRAGVRIRNISPASLIAEGDTAAVGVIRSLVKRRGVIPSRKVLQCLVKAKCAPIAAVQILAAERILCVDRRSLEIETLSVVVRIDGAEGMASAQAKAKVQRTPYWSELKARWLGRLDGVSQ